MLTAVLAPFIAAALAPALVRTAGDRAGPILAVVPAAIFAWAIAQLGHLQDGVLEGTPWVPGLDVGLDFALDGLSGLFVLLVSGIGTLVVLYAGGYLKGHPMLGRFFLFLMMFMGAMLGLVLADNVITLFVFWELTSLASYLLVGFESEKPAARRAALQALLITASGGLALLAGLILAAIAGGSWRISDLIAAGEAIRAHALYLPAMALIVLGCFTKSAQWPFHSWLPGAMQAPTPVSAYLHSATMVKAGVYLLARLDPAFGGTPAWTTTLMLFGAVTMLAGLLLALLETDLKLVLAWTTVSALGALVFMIGPATEDSARAAMAFLLTHALYKGALFMAAGNVDHEAGTRDLRDLSGLIRAMPVTFVATAVSCASMAGLPFSLGWVTKGITGAAALTAGGVLPPTVANLATLMLVAIAGVVTLSPFLGGRSAAAEEAHEAPWSMLAGPLTLAALSLLFGILPGPVADTLLAPAASAVAAAPVTLEAKVIKPFDWMLGVTLAAFAAGSWLYVLWRRHGERWRALLAPVTARGPDAGYDRALAGLAAFAGWQTRLLQPGLLHRYMAATFLVIILAAGASLSRGEVRLALGGGGARLIELAVITLTAVGAIVAAIATTRLLAVTALGVVGIGVALIFMLFGAPDLAITQFMVETLVVVLLALVLVRLPGFRLSAAADRPRWLHAAISAGTGVLVSVLLLGVLAEPFDPRLSEWFARTAVPEAFGHNIVNVILVDFRALDTLGEIIVVFAAALAGLAAIGLGATRERR
ncbi:MAG: hydrogen gas-evolving membrane-bound hydrogenase subunit E [Acetobacteraceae bacterium]